MGLLDLAQQFGGLFGNTQGQPQQGISVQDGSGQSVGQLPFSASEVHPSVWGMLKNLQPVETPEPTEGMPRPLGAPDMGVGGGMGVPSHFTPLSAMKFGLGGFR